jgi:nucleoside-diphosphate-sugar epimerase
MRDVLTAYVGKRVLVTGGGGYLACGLVRALSTVSTTVIRLRRPGADRGGTVPAGCVARIDDASGDVRDPDLWSEILPGIDFVFHFAAQTSVRRADEDPLADLSANVRPMLLLLETCHRNHQAPVVLFAGTATQTGTPASVPVDETHPDAPATIYDLHKLVAEQCLEHYTRRGVVRGATLRLANVYGPGPASSSADRGVLNRMVRKALQGEPLTVYGSGEYLRDYVYVDDVTAAFLAAGTCIDRTQGRHFQVGSGTGHTVAQAINLVASRVALKTGSVVPVLHIEPPTPMHPIEARNFVADTTSFRAATDWSPRVSLAEGIDRTIVYLSAAAGSGRWST